MQTRVNQKQAQYNGIDIPIFLIDNQSRILVSNSNAGQFFKEKSGTRIQKNTQLNQIFSEKDQLQFKQTLQACQKKEKQVHSISLKINDDHEPNIQQVELNKTIQKNLNFISNDQLIFNYQTDSNYYYNFTIKAIKWKQGMRCFIVVVAGQKDFLVEQNMLFYIKYNAWNLLIQLQYDYNKWDNLRVLNVIKESDLRLLSNAIQEQYFILNWLYLFILKTPKLNQDTIIVNFKRKPKLYLIFFKLKTLSFVPSNNLLPPTQRNSVQLNYFMMSHYPKKCEVILLPSIQQKFPFSYYPQSIFIFLEAFVTLSNQKSSSRKLTVQCNFQRVALNNEGYYIEVQMQWLNETLFVNTFNKILKDEVVDSKLLSEHNQIYLTTLKEMMDNNHFTGELHENSFKMIFKFQLFEQVHTYSKTNEEHQQKLFVLPFLSLSFAREKVDQGHYIWKQKAQPNLTINKAEIPSMKMNKNVTPVFFKKFAAATANEIKKPTHTPMVSNSSLKNIKDEKNQKESKMRQKEKKKSKSKFKPEIQLQNSVQISLRQKLEMLKPIISEQITQLLKQYVEHDNEINVSINQVENEDEEENNGRGTSSDKGSSPIVGQKMFEFKSPQIRKGRNILAQRKIKPNKSKYFNLLSKKQTVEIKESDEENSLNSYSAKVIYILWIQLLLKRRMRREQQLFTQLTRQPSVINTIIKAKTGKKSIQEDSLDLSESTVKNTYLTTLVNKCRSQHHSKKWTFRQNAFQTSFNKNNIILAFLQKKINKEFMISILKRDALQNKSIQFIQSVKELMEMYNEKLREGVLWDKIFIDQISYEVCKMIQVIKDMEATFNQRSCIVIINECYVKDADYVIKNIYDENQIQRIILT